MRRKRRNTTPSLGTACNTARNLVAMLSRRGRYFRFNGEKYPYFLARYNHAAINERTVEIPIIREIIRENRGRDILEVGNVLSHYGPVAHTVLDKYERGGRIINNDICTFSTEKRFGLIVSISTLEHIGYDEIPMKLENCIMAFNNIKNLLTLFGQAWITIPVGYNPFIDWCLKTGAIAFDEAYGMKRVSNHNDWLQCPVDEVLELPYGPPYTTSGAMGIVIGTCKWKGQG